MIHLSADHSVILYNLPQSENNTMNFEIISFKKSRCLSFVSSCLTFSFKNYSLMIHYVLTLTFENSPPSHNWNPFLKASVGFPYPFVWVRESNRCCKAYHSYCVGTNQQYTCVLLWSSQKSQCAARDDPNSISKISSGESEA